jgi:hypothetical protein
VRPRSILTNRAPSKRRATERVGWEKKDRGIR